jgi:hypothetical protein
MSPWPRRCRCACSSKLHERELIRILVGLQLADVACSFVVICVDEEPSEGIKDCDA